MQNDDLPAQLAAGDAEARGIRVIDAATGEPIARVIEADAQAGTLSRYALKDGNLVREGDRFLVLAEEREIRFEWIAPAADEPAPEGEA